VTSLVQNCTSKANRTKIIKYTVRLHLENIFREYSSEHLFNVSSLEKRYTRMLLYLFQKPVDELVKTLLVRPTLSDIKASKPAFKYLLRFAVLCNISRKHASLRHLQLRTIIVGSVDVRQNYVQHSRVPQVRSSDSYKLYLYTGWSDVTESMVTIHREYNTT